MKLAMDALALCRSNAHGCLPRLHEAFGPIPLHCDILAPAHDCLAPLMVATTLLCEAFSLFELLHTVTLRLPSKYTLASTVCLHVLHTVLSVRCVCNTEVMTGQAEVISHDVHRAHVLEECLSDRGCQRRVQLEGKPFPEST
jgi:hypothetical protein